MIFETIRLALRTLRTQLFRTALTTLSVTIGAFSIVVMLSLAQSGHKTLTQFVEDLGGMRLILWVPNSGLDAKERSRYDDGITEEDIRLLRQLPHLKSVTAESILGRKTVYHTADNRSEPDVVGATDGLLESFDWEPERGRVIDASDNTLRRRVAVITYELSEALFSSIDVVGRNIYILGEPYQVVGVLEKRTVFGVGLGFSWDKSVFIPYKTAEDREGVPSEAKFVIGKTIDPIHNPTVVSLAESLLLSRHRGVEDFRTLDFSEILAEFYQFFTILDLVVAFIAGVSLFAGGIGVMNIMLVSVSERIREIGIRKAVGARVVDIMAQFLIEASTLSIMGGLLGVVTGVGVTFIAHGVIEGFFEQWIRTYSVMGIATALISTGVIGLVFGAVPAYRAAKLDIVEALRR